MKIDVIDEHYYSLERVLPILKEVARGELHWNDTDDQYCAFDICDYYNWSHKYHSQDCPVTLARRILKEQGIPLMVWTLTYEFRAARSSNWHTVQVVSIDYTEQEAIARFPESPDLDDMHVSKRRNIQVIARREIEDNEAEP